MSKLYGVFAIMNPESDPIRVWPITWSVDLDHCVAVRRACRDQAKAFEADLKIVWQKMETLRVPDPMRRSRAPVSPRPMIRNKNYEDELTAYTRAREKLESEEHEIHRKHAESMLDPLFPMGTEGYIHEVVYVVWALCEDMRSDLTPAEMLLMRGKLHGLGETSISFPPNLDPDPKEPSD